MSDWGGRDVERISYTVYALCMAVGQPRYKGTVAELLHNCVQGAVYVPPQRRARVPNKALGFCIATDILQGRCPWSWYSVAPTGLTTTLPGLAVAVHTCLCVNY